MSGTVGASNIRNDVRKTIVDRTPKFLIPNVSEDGQRLRNENLVQPPERSRTTEVRTLMEFYSLFKKVLEAATEIDGTNYPIRFTLDFPPTSTELPCFSIKLVSRNPLNLRGTKEMAPRFMGEYEDPDYPGELIQEYLVRRYNTVELTVWAKTNKVANQLAEWLEDKYWEYLWALQWGGLAHPVEWLNRGADRYEQIREQQMYGAPTTFGVVTAKITKKRVTAIRKLVLSLGLVIEPDPNIL